MSNVIDERVVALEFDNKKFSDNVADSLSILEKLKEKLNFKESGKGLGDFQKKLDSLNTDNISKGVEALENRFSALGIVGMRIIENLTDKAMAFGKGLWDNSIGQILSGGKTRALNLEQARFQLRGLFKEAANNAPKTEQIMTDVKNSVDGTAYSLDQAAVVASQLAASGIEASEAGGEMLTVLKAVAGVAAMTNSDFSSVGQIFTKVAGNGRMMGMELRQLSSYGMNAAATIRDYWNDTLDGTSNATEEMRARLSELSSGAKVTEADIRELTTEGAVSFDIFAQAMNYAFGEQAAKANDTYAGSLANVKSALSRIGAKFYETHLENMRNIFNSLRPAINSVSDALDPFIEALKSISTKSSKGLVKFLDTFTELNLAKPILQSLFNIFKAIGSVLKPIGKAFKSVFSGSYLKGVSTVAEGLEKFTSKLAIGEKTAKAIEIVFKGLFTVIKFIGKILGGVIVVFTKFASVLNIIRDAISSVVDRIVEFIKSTGILQNIGSNIQNIFSRLPEIFNNIKTAITNAFSGSGELFASFSNNAKNIFNNIQNVFSRITPVISNFINTLKSNAPIMLEKLSNSLSTIFNTIKQNGPSVLSSFLGMMKKLIDVISTGVPKIVDTILKNILQIVQIISKYVEPIGNTLFDILIKAIQIIGSRAPELIRALSETLKSIIKAAFLEAVSTVTEIGSKLLTSIKNVFSASKVYAEDGSDGVKKSVSGIGESFENFKSKVSSITSKIAEFFKPLTDKIKNLFKGANILDIINTGSIALIAAQIRNFVKSFKDLNKNVSGLAKSAKSALDAFTKPMKDMQKAIKPSTILAIALAVAVLAASLYALSRLNVDQAALAVSLVTAMLLELVVALKKISNIEYDKSNIYSQVALIIAISLAVGLLAKALERLSVFQTWDSTWPAMAAITALLAGLVIALKQVAKSVKDFKDDGEMTFKDLVLVSLSIIALAKGVDILSKSLVRIKDLSGKDLAKGLSALVLILVTLTTFVKSIEKDADLDGTQKVLIAFAISLAGLYFAIKSLAEMKWLDLGKGVSVVIILLVALTAAIQKLGDTKIKGAASTILAMGVAMNMLVAPIFMLGRMRWSAIKKGLKALAAVFVMLGVSIRIMNPTILAGVAPTILAIAVAINLLMAPILILSRMNLKELAKGLIGVTTMIIAMAAAISAMAGVAKLLGGGFAANLIAMSVALIALSTAMALLVIPIKVLGKMKMKTIIKAIQGMMLALLGLAGVAIVMGTFATQIILGAAALGIFGAAIALLGFGLSKVAASLVAFAAISTAAIATVSSLIISLSIAIGVAFVNLMASLGTGIGLLLGNLGKSITDNRDNITDLFISLFAIIGDAINRAMPDLAAKLLEAVVKLLDVLIQYTPQIANKLFDFIISVINTLAERIPDIITAIANLIASILDELSKYNPPSMESIIEGLLGITAVIAILQALPLTAGLSAIAILAEFVAGFTLILVALGALNQISGFSWIIGEGIEVLAQLGTGIGKFVGSIISGFAEGLTANLPLLAENLSQFALNLIPFISVMSSINESVLTGVSSIAGAILALTAAELLDGISNLFSFITGGSSFVTLGQELAQFGPYMAQFSNSVSGVNGTQIAQVALAVKHLALAAQAIPNEGGWVAKLTGDNAIDDWGTKLPALGKGISKFATEVEGINVETIGPAARAVKTLAEAAQAIPNEGGFISKLTGDNAIDDWGNKLPALGQGLAKFAGNVGNANLESIGPAAEAVKALARANQEIPNIGGMVAEFVGDNAIDVFGSQLPALGDGLARFAGYVGNMNVDAIGPAADAVKQLAEVADDIPDTGGILAAFVGDNTLDGLGEQLASLGGSVKDFADSVDGINTFYIAAAVNAIVSIVNGVKDTDGKFPKLKNADTFGSNLAALGPYLKTFGENTNGINFSYAQLAAEVVSSMVTTLSGVEIPEGTNLPTFASNLSGLGPSLANFATSVDGVSFEGTDTAISTAKKLASFLKKIQDIKSGPVNTFKTELSQLSTVDYTGFVNAFKTGCDNLAKIFTDMFKNITKDFQTYTVKYNNLITRMMNGLLNKVKPYMGKFRAQGKNLMENFRSGLRSVNPAGAVSSLMNQAVNQLNQYNSFYQAGSNAAKGFVDGIDAHQRSSMDAGRRLAEWALNEARRKLIVNSPSKAMYRIGNFAGEGFVNGIKTNFESAGKAGSGLAEYALLAVNTAMSLLEDSDMSPTITPVLDLSNVQNGIGMMQSMFSSRPAYALAASTGTVTNASNSLLSTISANTRPADNNDIVLQLQNLRTDVRELNENMAKMEMVLDTGVLVGSIAAPLDAKLGKLATYKGRGN